MTLVDGICELTLETRDRAALEAFYTEVFRMQVISREPDRTWLEVAPGARLGLWTPGAKEFGDRGGRHVHFALCGAPGALELIAARLRRRGRPFRGPLEHDGGDRSLYVEDPEGNVVEAWDYAARGEEVGALP